MTSIKITGLALAGAALLGAAVSPAMAKPETRSGTALPRQAQTHVTKQTANAPALAIRDLQGNRRDRSRERLERRWLHHPGGACGVFDFRFCNDSPG